MAIPTATDCSHLPGRLRHICEGRAGLSLAKVNKYRAGWGLPPLTSSTDRKLTTAQRIASAASVMGKTALTAVTTGQAYASPETRAARLAICQTCEHFAKGTCSLCGCACNGKPSFANKLAHASSVCPATVPKWGPVEPAPQQPQRRPARGAGMGMPNPPPLIGVPIDRDKLQSHILYHVMPLAGETEWVWRRHCDWLRQVRPQYNGRLIIGIVTPGPNDHWTYCRPDAVREALAGLDAEFIEAPNDVVRKTERQGRGEGVLFPVMLERLQTDDPNQVGFYGHCKGVSRKNHPLGTPPHLWAEAMFETTFRNHANVINALDTHGICGPFCMRGGLPIGRPGIGPFWFFSGTFFAFRLVDVFRRNWRNLPSHYGCVEQWPRLNFRLDAESACLFFDGVNNLYDGDYWSKQVTPALIQWRKQHGPSRADRLLSETPRPVPALVPQSPGT